MIKTFTDRDTKNIFDRQVSRKYSTDLSNKAYKKLLLIDAADKLDDLKIPPGNRLEKLSGKLKEFYSIRINNQYRIIFIWKSGNAYKVQITDYHKG